MKKTTAFLLSLLFVFLCACSNNTISNETTEESGASETLTEAEKEMSTAESLEIEELEPAKVFTVYFSHNDPVGVMAEFIKENTNGGIFKIETVGEYPSDEKELLKKAADEYNKKVRPALKDAPQSMSEYDIVFLCFPAWEGTMPMALWTFIEDYDMRDKAILPVCFGSEEDLARAVRDINSLVPGMMIVNGFAFESDFSAVSSSFYSWINTALYG